MNPKNFATVAGIFAVTLALSFSASAQIGANGAYNYTGGTVTQNFQGFASPTGPRSLTEIGSSGQNGWFAIPQGGSPSATATSYAGAVESTTAPSLGFYYNSGTSNAGTSGRFGGDFSGDFGLGSYRTNQQDLIGIEIQNNSGLTYPAVTASFEIDRFFDLTNHASADDYEVFFAITDSPVTSDAELRAQFVNYGQITFAGATGSGTVAGDITGIVENFGSSITQTSPNRISITFPVYDLDDNDVEFESRIGPGQYIYLAFENGSTGRLGLLIDDFEFTAIPEPSTAVVALLLIGFTVRSALRRTQQVQPMTNA